MENRRKKNLIIGILFFLLIFVAIGYALLAKTFSINSTAKISSEWEIYVKSINVYDKSVTAYSKKNELGSDKLSVYFDTELSQPTDYIEYNVVVKNGGTLNAQLAEAIVIPDKSHEYVLYTTTAVKGTVLDSGEEMEFIVRIEFKNIENYTRTYETVRTLTRLQLNFIQKQENN